MRPVGSLQICNLAVGAVSRADFYSLLVSKGIAPANRRGLIQIKGQHHDRSQTLTLTLIAFAIAAPGLASASSLYHPADGEVGMTTHPDHMQSTMSRGDVLQAVEAARKDGTLAILSRGGALPVKSTGVTKTREQVQQEFLNMSAAEKKALLDMNGGAR